MKKIILCLFYIILSKLSFSQWNPNTSVNLDVSRTDISDLQTATTSDGKTWVAFYSNSGAGYKMHVQLLDVNGIKLFGPDGLLVCNQSSGSATSVFNVSVDQQNNLIIGHQYELNGSMIAVLSKVNIDGTIPWVNEAILGPGYSPYPSVNSSNEIYVTWLNEDSSTLSIQKVSSNGIIRWPSNVMVRVGSANTTRGQIVSHSNGDFTLLFQRRDGVINTSLFAQRYNTNGMTLWTNPLLLSNLSTSGARYYSLLAEGNTVYVGYYASSVFRFAAYIQKITSNGTLPWGINGSSVSTYSSDPDPIQMTTSIAHYPNSASIWSVTTYSYINQNNYGVYVQKLDTTTGNVQLNPLGKEIYPISGSRDQFCGKLALYNDGPVFLSYDNEYKIYVTRLNNNGDFVWSNRRIELSSTIYTLANPKDRFAFTDIVNNQAVALWTENRSAQSMGYAQNIILFSGLPITLLNFKGLLHNNQSDLMWETSSEINYLGFEIEKSDDGMRFEKIGFVKSQSKDGNSHDHLKYSYHDIQPLQKETYYRLKQVDMYGNYEYSTTISLKPAFKNQFGIISVFPNPARSNLFLSIESSSEKFIDFMITDAKGSHLFTERKKVVTGNNRLAFNVSKLSAGVYLIQTNNAEGKPTFKYFLKK